MTTETTTNGTATTKTEEKPKPTKDEIKAMISAYIKADDDVTTAEALLKKALEVRGVAAKEIHDKSGKAKYMIRGEVLTLTSRKSKKTGKETYFFKGQTDDDVIGGDD
jgi:hypothetical protein